jgi:hypothetical protein
MGKVGEKKFFKERRRGNPTRGHRGRLIAPEDVEHVQPDEKDQEERVDHQEESGDLRPGHLLSLYLPRLLPSYG